MRFLVVFLFTLNAALVSAQGLGFRQYTLNDGLPQNTITATFEDSEGFLWFGTQDGLCRYDGYSFRIFRNEPGNKKSLSDNYVLDIFEDEQHLLWIGCRNGISVFDRHTEEFRTIQVNAGKRFFPINNFYFYQPSGQSVHATSNRFMLEQEGDSTLEIKNVPWKIELNLSRGSSGFLTDSSFTIRKDVARTLPFPRQEKMRAWAIGKNNVLHVCTQSSLLFIDATNATIGDVPLPENVQPPFQLIVDEQEQTWLGTAKGVYVLRMEGDAEQWKKITVPGAPVDASISSLYEDRRGFVWIGTDYTGLYRYDPFSEVFCRAGEPELGSKLVWSFYERVPGELWVGTGNGVRIFTQRRQPSTDHNRDWSNETEFSKNTGIVLRKGLETLEGKTVTAICGTGDSIVWIGTKGFGIYGYDVKRKLIFAHFSHTETSERRISPGTIYCLAGGNDGKLYAGTSRGVTVISTRDLRLDSIQPSKLSGGINNDYIMSLFIDGEEVWMGTSLGLCVYDLLTGEHWSYAKTNGEFPNDFVTCIVKNPVNKNELWMGTLGSGIVVFDRVKKNYRMIDGAQGLENNSVYGILPGNGKMWASTNDGIASIEPASHFVQMFSDKDGTGTDEFSQNAWLRASNGELFFGTANGFLCFRPERVVRASRAPRIALTFTTINYQPVSAASQNIYGSRSRPQRIELWPGDRVLSLEYADVSSSGNHPVYYRYRLASFDEQWVTPPKEQRTISYTSLPPGEYTLEISASMHPGGKEAALLKIPVIVHPPFYSTWWFRLLAGLVITGIVVYTVRYFSQRRLREKLRELQTQRRIQEERERISRDLHDNVGAQLTYIITTLDNVALKMTKPGSEKAAQERIETLGGQARHTMQQLRESIWAINSTAITSEELARKTQEFMQQCAENHEHMQWEVQLQAGPFTLKPSTAIQLYRIIQEAVSNAFAHSGATKISVAFPFSEKEIVATIADNGKGFDTSMEKPGHYGIKNMPQRAQQIGAAYRIESGAKGTTITVSLPPE